MVCDLDGAQSDCLDTVKLIRSTQKTQNGAWIPAMGHARETKLSRVYVFDGRFCTWICCTLPGRFLIDRDRIKFNRPP
jgi:hypothetical protein